MYVVEERYFNSGKVRCELYETKETGLHDFQSLSVYDVYRFFFTDKKEAEAALIEHANAISEA